MTVSASSYCLVAMAWFYNNAELLWNLQNTFRDCLGLSCHFAGRVWKGASLQAEWTSQGWIRWIRWLSHILREEKTWPLSALFVARYFTCDPWPSICLDTESVWWAVMPQLFISGWQPHKPPLPSAQFMEAARDGLKWHQWHQWHREWGWTLCIH